MATKIFMEALSPTMEEGRLVKWLKNEGDAVKSGEPLAEVETDKAIMELVARGDGVLRKRLINEGDARPVGQLVGVIAAKDENIDAIVAEGSSAQPAKGSAPSAAQSSAPAPAPAAPPAAQAAPAAVTAPPAAPAPSAPTGNGGRAKSSPLARRIASERGLDISGVQGSGPGGRIIKRDIEAAGTSPSATAVGARSQRPRSGADFEDVPLTQIRK